MTQNEKDLLLKDLCARLPYGVKVYDIKSGINSSFMNLNHVNGTVKEVFISYMHKCRTAPIEDVKPYLFPMSSMTKEQKKEYAHILVYTSSVEMIQITGESTYDWLNKNMFDWRGLIPMGLAIDATNLNIY
jgi:hypothetical protein